MDPPNVLSSLQPDRTNRALIPWTDNELERYLRWMEENSELLQGPTNGWTSRLKETVFKDEDRIDVKRIKFKFHNMRTSWQRAKQMQERSGFGLTEAECSSSMNGELNLVKILRANQHKAKRNEAKLYPLIYRIPEQKMQILLET